MPSSSHSSSVPPHVRLASPADAPALALVGSATFLDGFAGFLPGDAILAHVLRNHSPDAYARYLASADVAAWIAEAPRGAPIGYSLLTPPELPDIAPQAADLELKRIYVLSRYQGSGAAQHLLDAAISEATSRLAPRLLLGVNTENARALRFYHRNGFRQIGTRQFQVGSLLCDDFILARPLP